MYSPSNHNLSIRLIKTLVALLATAWMIGSLTACTEQQTTQALNQSAMPPAPPGMSAHYCQNNPDDCNNHKDIFIDNRN